MTKHKCTWQLSEDGAAICLECTTIIGADGLIESLQTENTKLQEEIAALRHDIERHVAIAAEQATHIAALEKACAASAKCYPIVGIDVTSRTSYFDRKRMAEALRSAGYLGGGDE